MQLSPVAASVTVEVDAGIRSGINKFLSRLGINLKVCGASVDEVAPVCANPTLVAKIMPATIKRQIEIDCRGKFIGPSGEE
jgi:hypothetical protein